MADLFAILHAMEQEAAARYDALADRMREKGAEDVAAVFRQLADEEREHARRAARWCESRTGEAPASVDDRRRWPDPIDVDEAAAEIAAERPLTAYGALSLAVRGEERAFAFWSYVSAQARDPGIKAAAESVAHHELEHAALLRRERRRAYQSERGRAPKHANRTGAPRALLRAVEPAERRLGRALEQLADRLDEADSLRVRELAATSYAIADDLLRLVGGDERPEDAPPTVEAVEAQPMAQADDLAERYLAIAERAKDEALVAAVQSLVERAIARLSLLRNMV